MRDTETPCSIAAARSSGVGLSSAAAASGFGGGRSAALVVDMIGVSARTRDGCSIAIVCAIIPPNDAPTWCRRVPSWLWCR
ncbi:MAG: hypothetical protein H6R20_1436 [Proteobacteria bacterium]|nr:hypothetical protein [Pseudomonadota bacterium]